jgi:hypothetical protein
MRAAGAALMRNRPGSGMAISGDYPTPVNVNGYVCHNCTEVDQAKKNIDPAHPKAGPNGSDADIDPTLPSNDPRKVKAIEKAEQTRGENVASDAGFAGDRSKGLAVNILV